MWDWIFDVLALLGLFAVVCAAYRQALRSALDRRITNVDHVLDQRRAWQSVHKTKEEARSKQIFKSRSNQIYLTDEDRTSLSFRCLNMRQKALAVKNHIWVEVEGDY